MQLYLRRIKNVAVLPSNVKSLTTLPLSLALSLSLSILIIIKESYWKYKTLHNIWMFRRRKTLIIRRKNACETELSSLLCSLHMVFSFPPSWTKDFTNLTKLRHVYFTSRKTITRQEEFSSKGTDRQVCVLFQNTVSKALSFFSVPFCTSLWQMLN